MQPVEAQQGVCTKSQLSYSLKVYLNNKSRLQPIIGLGSIIECVRAGTHYGEALYLCEVCVCRLGKADVRNHIMGSLHRYNYIKTWHAELVSEWKENFDLSKMAWPLMEKARILEGQEGPGDIQLLEVEDAVYQKMATLSENNAITLINVFRDGQGQPNSHADTTSVQLEHHPIQSHRIVLLNQNQPRQSKNNTSTSPWDNTQSPEITVQSVNSNSFLDGYTGTKPLIGLFRVVECRSEDGHTYCFLCHCCRIRSNKKDIIDHLTSSCHLMNYLMETHPEQVEVMVADDNCKLLLSLAKTVEQEEGRGELMVVNAPESLCILLTGKSYHWCIKMLCNGGTHTDIQKRTMAVKGPSVNKTSSQGMPERCNTVSEWEKGMTPKRKKRKMSHTVFKVSLPLTKGSVMLKRTSFSVDSVPVSVAYSPPSDLDLIDLPEPQSEVDCELDCDARSFVEYTSHLEQEENDYYNVEEYFNQSEYTSGTKDPGFYVEENYTSPHESQKRPNERWQNEGPQTQNEWLPPAAHHAQDWTFYNSAYRHEEGFPEQWYNPASQSGAGTSVDASRNERPEMSSAAAQYDYRQQPQDQYMIQDHATPMTGSVGQPDMSGDMAPHFGVSLINMHPQLGDSLVHSGNIAQDPRVQFAQMQQKQWQTYMNSIMGHVQTAPQSYMTYPVAQQAIQISDTVLSYPNSDVEPVTNPDQHFPHPAVIWNPR